MLSKKTQIALALAVLGAAALPGAAHATNGYFAHGYGTSNKALAGAGVALPQSAMQAATNPAGMAYVGTRFDIGIEAFNPMRDYNTYGNGFNMNGTQDSENEWFFIPHIGYNYMLTKDTSLGLTLYGNGGMNSRYPQPVYAGFSNGRTGVNFAQLFAAFTFSQRVSDWFSYGVAPIFVYQRIALEGIQGFSLFSVSNTNVSNNGADNAYGGGARFGTQFDFGSAVSLGLSYQTRMRMSKFDKYQGTFAEGGDFDIPSNYTVGLAIKPAKTLTFLIDFQHIEYSGVETVANKMHEFITNVGPGSLGGQNGAGFYWQDMDILKFGIQWDASKTLTLRAGYSHGDQPIVGGNERDSTGATVSAIQFNIIAPAVIDEHITLGFTKKLASGNEVSMAYMHAIKNTVRGENLFGGGTTELTMSQNALEVSYGIKW